MNRFFDFKQIQARFPFLQLAILSSLVLVFALAILTLYLILNRQFAIQEEPKQFGTEQDASYHLALLLYEHIALYDLVRANDQSFTVAGYQHQHALLEQRLQILQTLYHNLDAHPDVQQQFHLYETAWAALQAPLNTWLKTPQDKALQAALSVQLQAMTALLRHLLEMNQFTFKEHLSAWFNALSHLSTLLTVITSVFVLSILLTFYGFFQFNRERQRVEAALRTSEHRHRVLLDTIPDIVLRRKRDGTYTDYKPAKAFGTFMPQADFIGKHITEILPPAIAQLSMEASERALVTGQEQIYEYRMPHRKTGMLRDYEGRVFPCGEDEVQVILRDVTDEKVQKERWHQAQKLESLGVLAGGIAHDFNNLLTGMLSQSSLAKFKLARGLPALEHIEKTVTAAERAADLTRQLLAYAGKGKFQIIALDLNQVLRETVGLLEAALPNRATLQLQLTEPLPLIEADHGQIQQVAMNLVINAAEALGENGGYVRLITKVEQVTAANHANPYLGAPLPPGDYVALQVADNGVGMDQATMQRIFDPFFSTKAHGHGLGLAATLGIIRTHHGGIQVETQPGVGTKFTVLLPATPLPAVAPGGAGQATVSVVADKQLVLVIDDEPSIREAISDILATEGVQVCVAASGEAGIAAFRQQHHQIGLILLDMKMPGLSGIETFQALRAIDPSLKVILSSGYHETEMHRFLGETGIIAFLQKPYDFTLLRQSVQNALI
ncbi:MAG: response regulator [Caldilineaceae bacterium]